jgi:hypothetical protein
VSKYYCFIAGLPEIRSEEFKLKYNLLEFKEILRIELGQKDFDLVTLFYRKYDIANLVAFLQNPDAIFDPRGIITAESIAAFLKLLKDGEKPVSVNLPYWYKEFIIAWQNEQPLFPGLSWEDQLTTLYFDAAIHCGNQFISDWFEFNLDISNILTAINCRKYSIDLTGAIVGSTELSDIIRSSSGKDFGIRHLFPYLDAVMRIADETNLLEREKKTDLLKWSWIAENSFHYFFDIENIFAYVLQTEILERWIRLNHETGNKLFKVFIDQLKESFLFPEEYKLNK